MGYTQSFFGRCFRFVEQSIYYIYYPWEPIFDQDMNGDGDKSGTISITLRDSDTDGIRIGDADGQLYIVDSEKQIAVSDPWIEDNHDWGDVATNLQRLR